ncbi:MAG: hypothetical protein J5938_02450 [Clostridia bacterium]|nr:hypothetical protein [Clostridia bacterium]
MKQTNFPSELRTSYTYRFADGSTYTVHIGDTDENGKVVTEEMLELLYLMDEGSGDEIQPEESEDEDSYTYAFSDGTTSTIRVGDVDENGAVVTAEMIKLLHQMDDKEMYNNRKNTKVPIGKWEVPGIERWKAAHPGEPLPTRYHIPLDALTKSEEGDDDCDKGNLAKASLAVNAGNSDVETLSPAVERTRKIVSKMKPELQRTYELLVVHGFSVSETAKLLRQPRRTIQWRKEKIIEIIKREF